MKCGIAVAAVFLGTALWCGGQANQTPGQTSAKTSMLRVIAHGSFPIKITKALDSGKLNKGDSIEAETAGSFRLPDGRLIAKGSKIFGHVTIASARSRGDSKSELGIIFDQVKVRHDGELRLRTLVQAVYPPTAAIDPGVVNGYTMGSDPGPGYIPPDIKIGSNTTSTANTQPVLDLQFVGVQGMHDLELKAGGVLGSSEGKRVRLGPDVRIVVRAVILG